jgi:hypothetical protein
MLLFFVESALDNAWTAAGGQDRIERTRHTDQPRRADRAAVDHTQNAPRAMQRA